MQGMTIGALAKAIGISRETVRYYERTGLLPKPDRTSSGYRQYSHDAVRRIRFIKRAQTFGFTLAEIGELLSLQFEADATCGDIAERARTKAAEVEQKIAEFETVRNALQTLIVKCGSDQSSECTVLLEETGCEDQPATCGNASSSPCSSTS